MTGRKDKHLDKAQPVRVQPSSDDLGTMVLAEITEIGRVDNLLLESPGLDDSALELSAINPLLYLLGTDMKRLRQRVFCEPILPMRPLAPNRRSMECMEAGDRRRSGVAIPNRA